MKYAILLAGLLSMSMFAQADTGDSRDRDQINAVSTGRSYNGNNGADYGSYETAAKGGSPVWLVRTAAGCSNAGDQVARPVYRVKKGRLVFAGYECVQDNRGGNGG